MPAEDDKIRREILKWIYERFEEKPHSQWRGQGLLDALESFDHENIIYNVNQMDGSFLENNPSMGTSIDLLRITPDGIEELHKQGYPTILDSEIRYKVLEVLYQAVRENPGRGFVSREDLLEHVDASEEQVHQNIWYLKEKRIIETSGGGGGHFYHRAKLTQRGNERYEQYVDDGVGIPRVGEQSSLRQATIGPDESGKAENLFRDFVELAQEEIIIIDRYAREPLYDLLQHVPSGVQIRVVTTSRVTGGGYLKRVQQFAKQHPDIEVRELSDADWGFHDRYIIRDREDAWAWGHSFHDAGDTQHTASELKPINRETIIDQFTDAWKQGSVVV